jgi:hypothetical protein
MPEAARRNQSEWELVMEGGKGRRDVRGMFVRGIMQTTPSSVPLTSGSLEKQMPGLFEKH